MNGKQNVVMFTQRNIIQLEKERNSDTQYNTDEPGRQYAKWNEPDAEGQMSYDCSSVKRLEQANSEKGSRTAIARGRGRGERELFFNGYSISVWDDGRLLEKDGGRGCTTT